MPVLRPLEAADVPAAHALTTATFADLERRRGMPEPPPRAHGPAHARFHRLLATDPGGAWAAEDEAGALTGVALALRREAVWGLSMLVVRPDAQSGGIGRALLDRTLEYAAGTRGAIILSSDDPRALRAYARAGFTMHPAAAAEGVPRGVRADPSVRPFSPADHPLAAAVDRAVRTAPHGADLDVLAAGGCELLVLPDGGYAAHLRGEVKLLAAFDDAGAAALLRSVLARVPAGGRATVDWLTGAQGWAVDVALEAGLGLRLSKAVFLRGDVGPFRPYLPAGSYL